MNEVKKHITFCVVKNHLHGLNTPLNPSVFYEMQLFLINTFTGYYYLSARKIEVNDYGQHHITVMPTDDYTILPHFTTIV